MKKIIILSTFVLLTIASFSQEKSKFGIFGGFGGPMINTSFMSNPSISIGGGGAMLITRHLFIGGYGQGTSSINPIYSDIENYNNYSIESEIGGLWIGYIMRSKKYYTTFSAKSAWGTLALINTEDLITRYDNIAVITPSIEIERKFNFMSIAIGANYQIYQNVDLLTYSNPDFSALGVSLNLKFGVF